MVQYALGSVIRMMTNINKINTEIPYHGQTDYYC